MHRRLLLLIVILILLPLPTSRGEDQPNVVFVITDDQGYGDLSLYGNPVVKTPQLDALGRDSVRLEDYHVAPTCSPTRAALITGHWTNRTGVWHTVKGRSMLRENEVTIGQIFQAAGYATGLFGKWHLGDNYPFRPEDRGFGEVLRHGGGGVGQTPDYWDNAYFDDTYFHNGKAVATKGYCTDTFFAYAKKFIAAQAAAGRPFFAYISTNAPHGPNHAPPEYAQPYLDAGLDADVAHFFGMIANIDHNVGELRSWLETQRLADNTIFIFTTDNGTATGKKVFDGGMRGSKGSQYDGGHRVPFFVHWPAGKLTGGRTVGQITAHVDVVPTLIDLCQIGSPPGVKFDGISLRPLLEDTRDGRWPDRILVTDSQRVTDPIQWRRSAVMTNRWRLVSHNKRDQVKHELYDIQVDPKQVHDVLDQYPEVVGRLQSFYQAWWAELEPTFGTPTRIVLGNPAENPTRLTCHDWITEDATPWNQAQIREALRVPRHTGYWTLHVETPGQYEIELRRWPQEGTAATMAINAEIPASADVPGEQAYRARVGQPISAVEAVVKIGGQHHTAEVPEGATHVTVPVTLDAGPTELTATFLGEDGRQTGVYYVYVRKL